MKVITYHYVQEHNPYLNKLNFLHIDNFIKQLNYLKSKYYFPTKKEFLDYITLNKELPENSLILTFDDGLKCHYTYVFQELYKQKLWGIFYITSKPYLEKKILNVHKIHIILAKYSCEKVYKILMDILKCYNTESFNNYNENDLYKNNEIINDENKFLKKIKIILNYQIPYNQKDEIIDILANKLNIDFDKYFNTYYLSIKEIKEMNKCSMLFGNHTHNHVILSNLKKKQQEQEIKKTYKFIESILPNNIKSLCIPYGNNKCYNNNTIDILKQTKTLFNFTTEYGIINGNTNKLLIPRIDCNKFKYGSIYKV